MVQGINQYYDPQGGIQAMQELSFYFLQSKKTRDFNYHQICRKKKAIRYKNIDG